MPTPRSRLRRLAVPAVAATLLAVVAACGGADGTAGGTGTGETTVLVGALSNGAATETPITVSVVEEIRARLPQAIRDSGTSTSARARCPRAIRPWASPAATRRRSPAPSPTWPGSSPACWA